MTIEQYVEKARRDGASDIHLVRGSIPRYRIDGSIREMDGTHPLTEENCAELAVALVGSEIRHAEMVGDLELSESIAGVRCRINLFRQQTAWSAAIRLLNDHIPDLDELGLPKAAAEFPAYSQGLVLVTGEAGSGKSTTLAAMLNQINRNEAKHILTLERPIEYVYTPMRCVINQREVGKDTQSFATGLRAALREDPDVIFVGELRDLETIETALTAAETGRLVFGTVHTSSAAGSIERIAGVFPLERQQQIRHQLSVSLKAVLSQRLLPRVGGGRVLACEVMKADGTIRSLIREGKTTRIANYIQAAGSAGNILMDKALDALLSSGSISQEIYRSALGDLSQTGGKPA